MPKGLEPDMSDLLAWVSVVLAVVSIMLQVYSMRSPKPVSTRIKRVRRGVSEINLGLYRRRVRWTEDRDTLR